MGVNNHLDLLHKQIPNKKNNCLSKNHQVHSYACYGTRTKIKLWMVARTWLSPLAGSCQLFTSTLPGADRRYNPDLYNHWQERQNRNALGTYATSRWETRRQGRLLSVEVTFTSRKLSCVLTRSSHHVPICQILMALAIPHSIKGLIKGRKREDNLEDAACKGKAQI